MSESGAVMHTGAAAGPSAGCGPNKPSEASVMRLHVQRGGAGSPVRLRTSSGLLAPRILRMTPTSAYVALIATNALLLAGDAVRLDIRIDEGLSLDLIDIAATVAYSGRGGTCSWSANLGVSEGASLTWLGEPFVVATDARAVRETHADVADGGSLVLRDTLVLGRHGERGGDLRAVTNLSYAGRPALVEEFHLSPDDDAPGIRGGHRVIDQITTLGASTDASSGPPRGLSPSGRQTSTGVTCLDLLAPGHIQRWLGDDAHASPLGR